MHSNDQTCFNSTRNLLAWRKATILFKNSMYTRRFWIALILFCWAILLLQASWEKRGLRAILQYTIEKRMIKLFLIVSPIRTLKNFNHYCNQLQCLIML